MLVFLTGQAEIDAAIAQLQTAMRDLPPDSCKDLLLLPLYSALPLDMQVNNSCVCCSSEVLLGLQYPLPLLEMPHCCCSVTVACHGLPAPPDAAAYYPT